MYLQQDTLQYKMNTSKLNAHLVVFYDLQPWNRINLFSNTRLTALFPGLHRWAGTRKVKPIWISLKQETVSGSGISWAMQVCTSLQTDNHASTPPLSFLQAGCPSCRPTNSVKAQQALKPVLKEVDN